MTARVTSAALTSEQYFGVTRRDVDHVRRHLQLAEEVRRARPLARVTLGLLAGVAVAPGVALAWGRIVSTLSDTDAVISYERYDNARRDGTCVGVGGSGRYGFRCVR